MSQELEKVFEQVFGKPLSDNVLKEMGSYIDIVFSDPPGRESQFVDIEGPDGHSMRVGKWHKRATGYWVLRIPCILLKGKDEEELV